MKKVIMLLFVFSISFNLTAQKRINIDKLNIDQPNLDIPKAFKLRNTGKILTLVGLPVFVIGEGLAIYWFFRWWGEPYENWGDVDWNARAAISGNIGLWGGLAPTIVGTPLWIIGGKRINKAELALKTFNIMPENSMALGLGITFRF